MTNLRHLPVKSWPILWHELIVEIEIFSAAHHMPLDNVWALVHANDYFGAVELFEQIRDAEHHYVGPTQDGA
jgi:hypothetical protein